MPTNEPCLLFLQDVKDSLEIRPGLFLGGMESAMELVNAGEAQPNEFKVHPKP